MSTTKQSLVSKLEIETDLEKKLDLLIYGIAERISKQVREEPDLNKKLEMIINSMPWLNDES